MNAVSASICYSGTYNETWCAMLYMRPRSSSIWVINLFSRCFLRPNIDARDTLRGCTANGRCWFMYAFIYSTLYLLYISYKEIKLMLRIIYICIYIKSVYRCLIILINDVCLCIIFFSIIWNFLSVLFYIDYWYFT